MASSHIINYVTELFPNKSVETINEIINMVQSSSPADDQDQQLENIVNLLIGDNQQEVEHNTTAYFEDDSELLDEARGQTHTSDANLSLFFEQLTTIFPDACPTYITSLCRKHARTGATLDSIVQAMTISDYPKKGVDVFQVSGILKELLPNADPLYLQQQAEVLAYKGENELKSFVEKAIEDDNYPTLRDFMKKQQDINAIKCYTTDFNLQQFIVLFPNPEQYFSNPNRKSPLSQNTSNEEASTGNISEDELYALNFFYNHYRYLRKKDIDRVFTMSNKSLMKTAARLDRMRNAFKIARKPIEVEVFSKNIPLLEEIAYIKHRKAIKKIIKECDENYRLAKDDARENGLLQTCACCFDEELIPEECYFCKNACIFCKPCVKNSTEVAIGDGNLDFPCLADCGSEFSIPTLQMVLDSVVFSKMAQRKQMEEIKRANIEGLETCPFCEYATIPSPDSKIFKCLNEDCMKETCRACRHIAHIPLRCEEIEYDEDVKMRTYIENKMTEALLRTCWKCNKVYIKSSGCNKMTCSCGAQMCYVCKQRVNDYTHFDQAGNGKGCPLYTQDLNKLHNDAVLQGAAAAKVHLGVDKNPKLLKNDPSKGFNA